MLKLKLFFIFLLPFVAIGQDYGALKFGDVTVADLQRTGYAVDSSADAVVLSDIGKCSFSGNNKSWFSLVFRHFRRVHVLHKNGFDIADVFIDLYKSGENEEKLDKIKAVTYTLENGKIIQTKLDNKSIFSEKLSKYVSRKKFTFPNVKEGSIIEFEYTIISDYIQFPDPWEFQGKYPCLWSEYSFAIPSFFTYDFLRQGYLKYDITDRKDGVASYTVRFDNTFGQTQSISVNAGQSDFRWIVKNAPAFKDESYTSSINNYIQKIQFQLAEQREPLEPHRYIESWEQVAGQLMKDESFGEELEKDPAWLDDVVKPLVKGFTNDQEKANAIYRYVRDNFTCTGHQQLWTDKGFRELVRSRSGGVAEINLFLVGLLRHAGLAADPVMMSTRQNGQTYEQFPILRQFNYVIAKTIVADKEVYLDATEPGLGFGHLPLRCYNDHARVVNTSADLVKLTADSIMEKENTTVFLVNEKGQLAGSVQQVKGYYESLSLRSKLKESSAEGLMKEIQKNYGPEFSVVNGRIDSLANDQAPLAIHYELVYKHNNADILYLNPLLGEGIKENPFRAAGRSYPVEMPYAVDETYSLALEVPEGYTVDELPKEAIIKLNEKGDGLFEYRMSKSGSMISFRSRLYLKRANYRPEEYDNLKTFFDLIVKKQAELIVLKKQKQ
jgi:transglutaminase-like putative cysteine protease